MLCNKYPQTHVQTTKSNSSYAHGPADLSWTVLSDSVLIWGSSCAWLPHVGWAEDFLFWDPT